MDKQEYIETILSMIKNKDAKPMIKLELQNHIDDRIEYYSDAGYNIDNATQKAIEHMGDPLTISTQLNKIHNNRIHWMFYILTVILYTVVVVLGSIAVVFTPGIFPLKTTFAWFEIIFFVCMLITMIIALLKRNYKYALCSQYLSVGILMFLTYIIINYIFQDTTFQFISPTVYLIHCFANDEPNCFGEVLSNFENVRLHFDFVIQFTSILFYLFIFLLNIITIITIRKSYKATLNQSKKSVNRLAVSLTVLTILLLLVLPIENFLVSKYSNSIDSTKTVDSIYVYESDTKCKLVDAQKTIFEPNYDIFTQYAYIENIYDYSQTDDRISYNYEDIYLHYNDNIDYMIRYNNHIISTDKKYVYILINYTDYQHTEVDESTIPPWREATEGMSVEGSIEGTPTALNRFKITVTQ